MSMHLSWKIRKKTETRPFFFSKFLKKCRTLFAAGPPGPGDSEGSGGLSYATDSQRFPPALKHVIVASEVKFQKLRLSKKKLVPSYRRIKHAYIISCILGQINQD